MPAFSNKFDRVTIILSTGRTATMALAQFLDRSCPGVRAVHEPPPSRHLRIASNRFLSGRLDGHFLVEKYVNSRRPLFAAIREPFYVESNNFLHGLATLFDEIFDAPRVVHVVRDPRTFVVSWVNHGVLNGFKGMVSRYHPDWLLKPEHLQSAPAKRWHRMLPIERLAWYWNAINLQICRAADTLGGRYMMVRYEDLCSDSGDTLDKIVRFSGTVASRGPLDSFRDNRVNAGRRGRCAPFEKWEQTDQDVLYHHCRGLMMQFGYIS
jgi:hypothetical protein